ncbi:MAG: DUF2934 domain-containing protein [Methylophilaceae bacterium]
MAVSPTKKPTTKPTAKKATTSKKPATKKTTTKKTPTKARKISAEERYKMVEIAAYYIAENHQFKGNAIDFWIAAEEEINKKLA